ncbi:MAG: hypothetical protein INR68_16730 [Methylobacterium mesophilicum]|nr:hypothetical protein [Methylobacterium mesophilicum]
MPHRRRVLSPSGPLTEPEYREELRRVLLPLCSKHGPSKVALALGCKTDKTVRDARDEKATLRGDYAVNLLGLDPQALDGFLARFGRRSVPLDATCVGDDRVAQSSVLKAALALSIALEDDGEITPKEVRDNRATIEAAIAALQGLLGRVVRAA